MRTMLIAEPGCTHEGDPARMKQLIAVARESGATACKFQWVSDPAQLCQRRKAPQYREAYEWISFPQEWHAQLARFCHEAGMLYGCTVYLPQDVAVIDPSVDFYKVAAFEAEARDLLAEYARLMPGNTKRLLISLGLGSSLSTANSCFDFLWRHQNVSRIVPLHCVSAYPTPLDQLNLMTLARDRLGLSDHADPTQEWTGAIAVAVGAVVVERHFRLDDCRPGNRDFPASMSPAAFARYVANIRFTERVLGNDDDGERLQACELPMLRHKVIGGS